MNSSALQTPRARSPRLRRMLHHYLMHLLAAFVLVIVAIPRVLAAPDPAMPAPEKAIVIDLHRPWIDGSRYDKDVSAPTVYGVDAVAAHPKFTVVDAQTRAMWLYRFGVPIDVTAYPIVTMKYRCANISKSQEYALRLVRGQGNGPTRVLLGTGTDLIADGAEHEFTKDLRELNLGSQEIVSFGMGVKTDQEPAWLELLDLQFSAPADAAPPAIKDEAPVQVRVVDMKDQPLADATVIVDAERANFARSAKTDKDGLATITPLATASQKHM